MSPDVCILFLDVVHAGNITACALFRLLFEAQQYLCIRNFVAGQPMPRWNTSIQVLLNLNPLLRTSSADKGRSFWYPVHFVKFIKSISYIYLYKTETNLKIINLYLG